MIRKVVSVAFVIGVLVALMSAASTRSVAQTATPQASTSEAGAGPAAELCSDTEITNGDTGIVVEPPDGAGEVKPANAPDRLLWVVEVTILPESCYEFHMQRGPVVLFVHSGSIEYGVSSATTPPATVTMGHQADETTFKPVPWDTLVPLNSGDWVTQDRAARFTYRNPGPDSAVVSMAAYVTPTSKGSGGKG